MYQQKTQKWIDKEVAVESDSIDTIEIRVKARTMFSDNKLRNAYFLKRNMETSFIVWPVSLFPQMFIQLALKTWTYCALSVKR